MIVKRLAVGPIMANCYIIGCETQKQSVVIDPGGDTDRILMQLAESKLTLKYIINTHGHFDHVGGNAQLKSATGADLLIHKLDEPLLSTLTMSAASFGLATENSPPADKTIEEGETIEFGQFKMSVLHTPGHTPGGISLTLDKMVFSGDTLFAGGVGRTDFPGGDFDTLITSIRDKLFTLPDDTRVLTGHGPDTTIGQEKQYNPFVRMI